MSRLHELTLSAFAARFWRGGYEAASALNGELVQALDVVRKQERLIAAQKAYIELLREKLAERQRLYSNIDLPALIRRQAG